MPPKKEVKQEKVLLGRPGNNLKSGIVCEDLPGTIGI
jgi:obg-like ATPase 1